MANKVVLGKPPEIPVQNVTVTLLDGSTAIIPCKFIYRTRTQFGAFMDEAEISPPQTAADADAASDSEQQKLTWEGAYTKGVEHMAASLCKVLKGWELDIPFDSKTIFQLVDEVPGVVQAIMDAYRAAILEGRLGNSATPPASPTSDS